MNREEIFRKLRESVLSARSKGLFNTIGSDTFVSNYIKELVDAELISQKDLVDNMEFPMPAITYNSVAFEDVSGVVSNKEDGVVEITLPRDKSDIEATVSFTNVLDTPPQLLFISCPLGLFKEGKDYTISSDEEYTVSFLTGGGSLLATLVGEIELTFTFSHGPYKEVKVNTEVRLPGQP